MDDIPFEKISLRDVINAPKESTFTPSKDWPALRGGSEAVTNQITPETRTWLGSLPKEIRPNWLIRDYPRIANRIAEKWNRPRMCEKYLDDLAMDDRGGRQGFSLNVALELASLKNFIANKFAEQKTDSWTNNPFK